MRKPAANASRRKNSGQIRKRAADGPTPARVRRIRALVRAMQRKARASGVKIHSSQHADGLYDE